MANVESAAEEIASLPPSARQPADDRLDYVDGLRAVAALVVILDHMQMMVYGRFPGFSPPDGLGHYTRLFLYGHFGVSMFIVVSGFCLMLPVVRGGGTLRGGFRAFIKRRANRLLPPYYLSIVACLVLGATVDLASGTPWDAMERWDPGHVTRRVLALHLAMVQQCFPDVWPLINSVYWSLGVEWWIYFLFPLLLFGWRKATPVGTVLIASAAGALVYLPIHATYDRVCPHFVALFAIGMLAATIAFSDRWDALRRRVPWDAAAGAGACLLAAAASRVPFARLDEALSDFAIACVLLLVLVAGSRPGPVRRIFSLRGLVAVGVYSYSVYLMHLPWLQIVHSQLIAPRRASLDADGQMLFLLAVGLPLALGWSYLFFLVCERPFLNRPVRRQSSSR